MFLSLFEVRNIILNCVFFNETELVYESHITQVKEEVTQLKSRLLELIALVQEVVSITSSTRFRLIFKIFMFSGAKC